MSIPQGSEDPFTLPPTHKSLSPVLWPYAHWIYYKFQWRLSASPLDHRYKLVSSGYSKLVSFQCAVYYYYFQNQMVQTWIDQVGVSLMSRIAWPHSEENVTKCEKKENSFRKISLLIIQEGNDFLIYSTFICKRKKNKGDSLMRKQKKKERKGKCKKTEECK